MERTGGNHLAVNDLCLMRFGTPSVHGEWINTMRPEKVSKVRKLLTDERGPVLDDALPPPNLSNWVLLS